MEPEDIEDKNQKPKRRDDEVRDEPPDFDENKGQRRDPGWGGTGGEKRDEPPEY